MRWSRRTCPFGLPDDAEDEIDNIILASIGRVLRAAATDIVETPLPARLVALLGQLEQRERDAQAARNAVVRRQRATLRAPVGCHAARFEPADPRTDAPAASEVQTGL